MSLSTKPANQAPEVWPLGALVNTNLGEGVIVGRCVASGIPYSVQLFDGSTRHQFPLKEEPHLPLITSVTLVERNPADDPRVCAGLRDYIRHRDGRRIVSTANQPQARYRPGVMRRRLARLPTMPVPDPA